MSYPKDELPAPEAAHEDSQAFELLRLWFAEGAPHLSARMELWPDPAAWGFMLGEVARDLAGRYAADAEVEPALVLERIRAGFGAEVEAHGGHGAMDEAPWGLRPGSTVD
jgi:hypothetical protein